MELDVIDKIGIVACTILVVLVICFSAGRIEKRLDKIEKILIEKVK